MARRALAPAVNPCAPAVPRQASRRAVFISFYYAARVFRIHNTILHTKRGQLFGAYGTRRQDFEITFSQISGGEIPGGGRYPIPHPSPVQPSAVQAPRCWDPDYRAPVRQESCAIAKMTARCVLYK